MRDGTTFADARDRALPALAERDRRLAYELAAGVLRHQRQLDAELDLPRVDPRIHDVLRLGAYQLRHLTRVPAHAAVSESVTLARDVAGPGAGRYVNQALRKLATAARRETADSHPDWLVARWRKRFGAEETARLLAWNDTPPPLTLQPARWTIAELGAALDGAGVGYRLAPYGMGLELLPAATAPRFPRPAALPGFAEGGFIIQAPAQALVVRFAAVTPGARVYDACAAPGGKAVALSCDGAQVVAGDGRADRIPKLAETVRRAARNVRCVAANLVAPPFGPGRFDVVLVDAPCTATGAMARHPDARWRVTETAIRRSAGRQRDLLDAAAVLVRPGGNLVYATCSLETEENEDQVEEFLARHRGYRRAPVTDAVPAAFLTAAGDFCALPQRHAIDGAYAARLARER